MSRFKVLDIITVEFEKGVVEYFIFELVYMMIFLIGWISLSESINNSRPVTFTYMFAIPLWEFICDTKNLFTKNRNSKKISDIIKFLPVTKKEKLLAKFIREFRVSLVLLIPYITIYAVSPKSYSAQGVRGEIVMLVAIITIWLCIRYIANYRKKYEGLKMLLGAFVFISIILITIDVGFNIGVYDEVIIRTIGNFYSGIIVGVLLLISIYYVNSKYAMRTYR